MHRKKRALNVMKLKTLEEAACGVTSQIKIIAAERILIIKVENVHWLCHYFQLPYEPMTNSNETLYGWIPRPINRSIKKM